MSRVLAVVSCGLVLVLAASSCVEPTPTAVAETATPAPTATCAPTQDCSPLGTRVAQMEATVAVWETVLPDVMQTAAALYEWSLTPTPACTSAVCPTPTTTPALCQRCRSDYDCPSGYICKSCATCIDLCVRVISPNGDCNNCLMEGVK